MINAHDARRETANVIASHNSSDVVKRFAPILESVIEEAVSHGQFEVDWDCSSEIDYHDDASSIVAIQLYLETYGYDVAIIREFNNYEDEDFDQYVIRISW